MKISCSLISSVSLLRRRTRTLMGAAYVASRALHSSTLYLGVSSMEIVDEGQLQVAVIVPDGGYIPEDLPEAGVQEPLVGLLLDLQKVRHLQHFFVAGKALAQRFSVVYILYHCS